MVSQILAVLIFLVMFALIITEKIERHIVRLGCGLLMIILVFGITMHSGSAIMETLNIGSIFTADFWHASSEAGESSSGINWSTIIFIAGMMIMVEGMGKAGFFRWLCLQIARLVHYKPIAVFVTFMIMSFVLAMFIDSITVILFLTAVTIELCLLLKSNPVPMIIAEIFCANLGGSATMCGDPPNIIIGTSMGYSFFDFLTNTGAIAAISLVVVVIYFYFCFRKKLVAPGTALVDPASCPDPNSAITDKKEFISSVVIFLIAVVLLVSHANTGLTVAFIGTFIAIITLIVEHKYAAELLKKVDYKTLLFFVGLFVVVGGLEQTGILELAAGFIGKVSHGNAKVMIAIIIWVSAKELGDLSSFAKPLIAKGYTLRRCATVKEFVEKIQIFEDGANDIAVELAKYDSFIDFLDSRKGKAEDVTSIDYVYTKDDVMKIDIRMDDKGMSFLIPVSGLHDELEANKEMFEIEDEQFPCINSDWILSVFMKAQGNA